MTDYRTEIDESGTVYKLLEVDGVLVSAKCKSESEIIFSTSSDDSELTRSSINELCNIMNVQSPDEVNYDETLILKLIGHKTDKVDHFTVTLNGEGFTIIKHNQCQTPLRIREDVRSDSEELMEYIQSILNDNSILVQKAKLRILTERSSCFISPSIDYPLRELYPIIKGLTKSVPYNPMSFDLVNKSDYETVIKLMEIISKPQLTSKDKRKCFKYLSLSHAVNKRIRTLLSSVLNDVEDDEQFSCIPLDKKYFNSIKLELMNLNSPLNSRESLDAIITVIRSCSNPGSLFSLMTWMTCLPEIVKNTSKIPKLMLGDFPIVCISKRELITKGRRLALSSIKTDEINTLSPSTLTMNWEEDSDDTRFEFTLSPSCLLKEIVPYCKTMFVSPIITIIELDLKSKQFLMIKEVNYSNLLKDQSLVNDFNKKTHDKIQTFAVNVQSSELKNISMNI